MATDKIRLPSDAATTGPYVATLTRTEDALTKHIFRVHFENAWTRSGAYRAVSSSYAILSAAHAATAGFWWLINPVGSAVTVDLTGIHFASFITGGSARTASPRLTLERVTFTGTASGTPRPISEKRETEPAATAVFLDASTGLTLTAGAAITAWLPLQMQTNTIQRAQHTHLNSVRWRDDEGPILVAGEGIVFRQADAGDATDGLRSVLAVPEWREYSSEF